MATNVERGGLGFEKFFRRRSSSVERSKDPENNVKTTKDDVEASAKEETGAGPSKLGKFFGQKHPEEKNDSADEPKSAAKQNDEVSSQKINESKKSSKKKKPASSPENTADKADDKRENPEPCKEFVIKDEVGQVKLTEIINNSIKEAVLNIVKEGVCPLADSLDLRPKDTAKKLPSTSGQEAQDKENKPGSPEHLPSLPSGANKTFDSHFCQSQHQQSSQTVSRSPYKLNDQQEQRLAAIQSIRGVSPRANKNRKVAKGSKQKDKSVREASPKICRQAKGESSHFRTDNRRMTGNVNIYICSEANENAKDKQKSKNKKECVDDSESGASSTLSVSTSKLVAALRKKQRKKMEDQPLSCVCEVPESSVEQYERDSKMGNDHDDHDDILCLCEENNADAEFLDTQTSSSRDSFIGEDAKFSDLDFPGSDLASLDQPCTSVASDDYVSYDKDDFWPCTSQDCDNYDDRDISTKFNAQKQGNNAEKDLEERCSCCNLKRCKKDNNAEKNLEECCSCCNLKRCKKDRPIALVPCPRARKNQPEQKKTRDKSSRTPRDKPQFSKCLCIVEEEDEDLCNDRKVSDEKFTVCGTPSVDVEHGNAQDQEKKLEKSPSRSGFGVSKKSKEEAASLETEKPTLVGISEITSTSDEKAADQKVEAPKVEVEAPKVEVEGDSKPQSRRPTLLSTLRKSFQRSSGSKDEESKASPETSKEEKQAKAAEAEENQRDSVALQGGGDNESSVADGKRKDSLLYRSIKRAMSIVKTRKAEDAVEVEGDEVAVAIEGRRETSENQAKPEINEEEVTNVEGHEESNKDKPSNEIDAEKMILNSGNTSKQEKRSKSRISTAIASRRSLAATSNEGSSVSVSRSEVNKLDDADDSLAINDTTNTEDPRQSVLGCKCGKTLSERSECRCKKPEPPKDDSCKCRTCCTKFRRETNGSSVCCKKLASPRREAGPCCPKCRNPVEKCMCSARNPEPVESGNPVEKCMCSARNPEPVERDPCMCCPRCSKPIPECKSCCSKQQTVDQELCKCCRRPKRLCRCCDSEENSRVNGSQIKTCRQPPDRQENRRQCNNCCSPKGECRCGQSSTSWEGPKSMICIYCDKPQDNCSCKAPIRKCSQCGLPLDVCNCKPLPCCDCSGRQIVPEEGNDGQTICVTAWKPRRNVRRYFAREDNFVDGNSEEDCPCYEKSKPYGSDKLPYQRGAVFSDVMNELQQKMSGSVCCNVCRNVPCNCCCAETEVKAERRPRQRLSTISEKRSVCQSQDRTRSESPIESCRCGTPRRKSGRKVAVSKICDRCRTSPCRCRRSSASPQKKPPAKCYYCKNSPCLCVPVSEPANPRPFRKADSSRRREKECNSTEEQVNANVTNEDNGHRGRESKHVVPRPGRQQPRKYCYRGNPAGQRTLNPGERVR